MPSRVIRGGFNSSESMAKVSLQAELMFAKLILGVDDYGRTDGRPVMLRSLLYPLRESVKVKDVGKWLAELTAGDDPTVWIYRVDDKPYVQLIKWEEHRGKSRRGQTSRWPDPTGSFPGSPRGSAGILGDPPGESGSRGVGVAGKEQTDGRDLYDGTSEKHGEQRLPSGHHSLTAKSIETMIKKRPSGQNLTPHQIVTWYVWKRQHVMDDYVHPRRGKIKDFEATARDWFDGQYFKFEEIKQAEEWIRLCNAHDRADEIKAARKPVPEFTKEEVDAASADW